MTDTPETDHLENELGTAAEMSHPTLWAFARKLERERDDAIAESINAVNHIIQVALERNEAKEELAVWKHEAEIVRAELKKADDAFESNISTFIDFREQRDRLAEALRRVRDGYGGQVVCPDCGCDDCAYLRPIDEALRSLTPNEP